MLFYCIDKDHPLYKKPINVDYARQQTDGRPFCTEANTNIPVDLRADQLSLRPPKDEPELKDLVKAFE